MIGQLYETYDFIPDEIWDYVESWFDYSLTSDESD